MSLIADSLKKIEKGENEAPEKNGGFVAPPLMQKDFGGINGKGKKGGGKGPIKILPLILIVIIVVIGGSGVYLYMTGGLDSFFGTEPAPIIERNVPEETPEPTPLPTETMIDMGAGEALPADNTTMTEPVPVGDIFETESAKDMNQADADNISVAAINANPAPTSPAIAEKNDNAALGKADIKDNAATAKKPNTAANSKINTGSKVSKTNGNKTQTSKSNNTSGKSGSSVTKTKNNVTAKQGNKTNATANVAKKPAKPVTINDKLEYTSLISQGEAAVESKNYSSAIELFKKAAQIENSNILMGNIGALYIKQGKPGLASEIVVVNKIKDPAIVSGLIVDMASERHFVQSLVLLKYAAKNLPPNSQLSYAEGYYYEMQRGYVKAAEFYRKAYDSNPREPGYLYAYARCLDYSEQYYKALENYIKVSAMKPDAKLKSVVDQRIRSLQGYLRQSR